MRILLSNDDGVMAPGIQTLAAALREFADVKLVAPDRNRKLVQPELSTSEMKEKSAVVC